MSKTHLITGAAILLASASSIIQASTTHDFTSGGTPYTTIGAGFGNALDFGDMTATAWGATGPDQGTGAWGDSIEAGEITQWSTGLGACNQNEGSIAAGTCSTSSQHQVDNKRSDDLALFFFDSNVLLDQIVIDPYFTSDVDVTFWVGNITNPDLTGLDDVTLLTAGFSNPVDVPFTGSTSTPQTINLGGLEGNALLIGGQRDTGAPDDDDYFKIASLTTSAVPVPSAVWLFGSGLLGLVGILRRKKAAA